MPTAKSRGTRSHWPGCEEYPGARPRGPLPVQSALDRYLENNRLKQLQRHGRQMFGCFHWRLCEAGIAVSTFPNSSPFNRRTRSKSDSPSRSRMASSNNGISSGFSINVTPRSAARLCCCDTAVIMMTGTDGWARRINSKTSQPFRSGMFKSNRTSSGRSATNVAAASRPEQARMTW